MTCSQALEVFTERDYRLALQKSLETARLFCDTHGEALAEHWSEALREIGGRLTQLPFAPRYLVHTYLRTDFLERTFRYRMYLYDEKWYFGAPPVIIGDFDAQVFHFWADFCGELLECRKKYVGKVCEAEVRNLAMGAAQAYNDLFAECLASYSDQIRLRPDNRWLSEHGGVKVYFGELMGKLFEIT